MTVSGKKKSPTLFFMAAFAVIIIIMVINNYRSNIERELKAPSGGIEKLYTLNNSMVAISKLGEVFVWDWNNIDKAPSINAIKSDKLLYVFDDKLLLVLSDKAREALIRNFKDDEIEQRVPLGENWYCECLYITRNGQNVLLALMEKSTANTDFVKRIRLTLLESDLKDINDVLTINADGDKLVVYEAVISESGKYIAIVGQKNHAGWLSLIDVARGKILWEKTFEDSSDFTDAAFSPGDEFVYAGGEGSIMYSFETISGRESKSYLMKDQSLPSNEQRVTCIEVSPNGEVVAAGVNPGNTVYVWDITTGKHLDTLGGCRGLNNIAFSPDSQLIVPAGRNYGGSFKVRKVPK